MTRAKICGLRTRDCVEAAAAGGAAYVGFVFFPKSPRNVDLETTRDLATATPPGVVKVALVVNPSDDMIDAVSGLPIDMLQLHGGETPERVSEVRARSGLPVMKAVGVADADDLPAIARYEDVADQLLIDAKPPKGGDLPGGNGLSFDWRLISTREWAKPWMLAGGLSAENVREALSLTGAVQVDVSSGVERSPGEKDPALIAAFLDACGAKQAFAI